MIELIDNLIQLAATAAGCVFSGIRLHKTRKQPFFLLTFFYGVFAISLLYWALHLLLLDETPPVFYVSDIGWIASYTFLVTLLYTMRTPAQRQRKTGLCWLAPVFCIPQFLLYISHGDVFLNLLSCTLTMLIAWFAIDGMVFSFRNPEQKHAAAFYMTALCFTVLEYGLWTSSCFWMGDTLRNPYFWFDFLLSACILLLLPTLRKAVAE